MRIFRTFSPQHKTTKSNQITESKVSKTLRLVSKYYKIISFFPGCFWLVFFFLIIWRDFTWCKVEFILFSLEQNKTSPTQQQQRSLSNVRVYLLVIMEGCDADGMWAQVLPLWPHCLSKPRPKWKQKPVAASETRLIESGILSLLLVTQWLAIALEV